MKKDERAMRMSGGRDAQTTVEAQRREERKADESRKNKGDGVILDRL